MVLTDKAGSLSIFSVIENLHEFVFVVIGNVLPTDTAVQVLSVRFAVGRPEFDSPIGHAKDF